MGESEKVNNKQKNKKQKFIETGCAALEDWKAVGIKFPQDVTRLRAGHC